MSRRVKRLEQELRDTLAEAQEQRRRANAADSALHRGEKEWKREREAYERRQAQASRAIEALRTERDEALAERDRGAQVAKLLAGSLLGVGTLGEVESGAVEIGEAAAQRIMADTRRPAVMHDQLTGKTVVRLIRPGNPAPWEDPR